MMKEDEGVADMKLGSHISIRNGYLAAARQARQIGARAFQYFPKNPRSLSVKSFDPKDAEHCASFCRSHQLESIAHAPYPVNLSAEEPELREQMKKSLLNDLEIANACGSSGLVVHFGKYKGKDPLEGYKLMIDMLNQILERWHGEAMILLENNAGQGARMGITLEEMVHVRQLTDYPEKIGFCLDTCHLFASGVWNGSNWPEVLAKGRVWGYFSHLRAVHLNDSVYPSGSFRDRHANIGKGFIGEAGLRGLLASDVIKGLPVVLETPGSANGTHEEEIRHIQALLS